MAGFVETASFRQEPGSPVMRRRLARQVRMAAADLRNVPRYALRALIGTALVCGLLSLWGLHDDGPMPEMSALSGLDPYRISSARCVAEGTAADARWNGLSPAVAILDRVNPAVATWVREKHRSGLVVFRDKYDPAVALAEYDRFGGRVVIYREALLREQRHHCRDTLPRIQAFAAKPGEMVPIRPVVPAGAGRQSLDHGERRPALRARGHTTPSSETANRAKRGWPRGRPPLCCKTRAAKRAARFLRPSQSSPRRIGCLDPPCWTVSSQSGVGTGGRCFDLPAWPDSPAA